MKTCEQCGNPVTDEVYVCPYCDGHDLQVAQGALVVRHIDLGHAGLSVAEARETLRDAIDVASYRGEDVLVVVHGYGSSGTGGHIRSMVRSEAHRALSEREPTVLAIQEVEPHGFNAGGVQRAGVDGPAKNAGAERRKRNPNHTPLLGRLKGRTTGDTAAPVSEAVIELDLEGPPASSNA
ncbi:MAG: hypothetical protein EBR20_03730 [Bacteroidetes bacterium]|nr:hypothetical protein [Bacteroidota bacterium]